MATGLWLRDLAPALHPTHSLVGTDIMTSYFPAPQPPNTLLTYQSITAPWPTDMHNSFDLVHQRLALPGCGEFPWRSAIRNLIGLVKPGGFIQLLEADHSHPGVAGPAMEQAFKLIKELLGTKAEYAPKLRQWLQEEGLLDVDEQILDVPIGKANGNEELGQKGAMSMSLATAGMAQFAKGEFE